MKTERTKIVPRALVSREVRPICNWHEFLLRWEAAVTIEEMLGLLHSGFSVSCFGRAKHEESDYNQADRPIFFLRVADGWLEAEALRSPTDSLVGYRYGIDKNGNSIHKSLSELRQILAMKAFDLLCLNFFCPQEKGADGREGRFDRYWSLNIVREEFFPFLLDFFRVESHRSLTKLVVVKNLSPGGDRSHNEKQAVSFLVDLAGFLWRWQETCDDYQRESRKKEIEDYNLAMRARIDSAKPWMIEVLSFLGRLDVLKPFVFNLDEACLAKLKEIALRVELRCTCPGYCDCGDHRPVSSVEEACLSDSPAAWFLIRHGLVTKEVARLKALNEAAEALAEAERQLERLKGV